MAFADHLKDPAWTKIYLLEIELGHRIDGDPWEALGVYGSFKYSEEKYGSTWETSGVYGSFKYSEKKYGSSGSWYILHTEGKPSKVEENGFEYTERASRALCNANASSWYWDSANSRLYVHTSGSDDPGTAEKYIILSYFWERIINMQFKEPVVFNGHYYLPYLNDEDVPNITMEIFGYHKGGLSQSFGTIRLINTDGYFDTRLSDYIYEAKKLIWKVGKKGDAYADYATLWIGWTGGNSWSDKEVEIEIEDLRKYT